VTPTIDDIKRAYGEIGAVAVAGEYFDRRDNVPHCCPMSALYAQKFGLDAAETMLNETIYDGDGDVDGVTQRFSEGLDLPPQFVTGVIDGVDGGRSRRDDPDYSAGFQLGATFRDVVLIGA
jgi:hypothetical protein